MRMQLDGINPDTVSGTVSINGQNYTYQRGRLTVNGQTLFISDDHDLIIDANRRVFAAVKDGVAVMVQYLPAAQKAAISAKYKLDL